MTLNAELTLESRMVSFRVREFDDIGVCRG